MALDDFVGAWLCSLSEETDRRDCGIINIYVYASSDEMYMEMQLYFEKVSLSENETNAESMNSSSCNLQREAWWLFKK